MELQLQPPVTATTVAGFLLPLGAKKPALLLPGTPMVFPLLT
jgi:hypothetical protein